MRMSAWLVTARVHADAAVKYVQGSLNVFLKGDKNMDRVLALQQLEFAEEVAGLLDNSSNSNTCSSESTGGCQVTTTVGGDAF